MAHDSEKGVGATINAWARTLRVRRSQLAVQLDEEKLVGLQGLEELGLPSNKPAFLPLRTFLQNPEGHLNRLGYNKFYISLLPSKAELTRYRQIDLKQSEVINFIKKTVPTLEIESYTIAILEFFKNEYAGNIVINPDGTIVVEMVKGNHGPLVSGAATPEFIARRDLFTRIFHYSFEDEALRRVIYNTLLTIPHWGEFRDLEFTQGYYEFALIKRSENAPLEPLFLDYRSNPVYHLNESL